MHSAAQPLERTRVLDLADEAGLLCGQILADLGADVVAVEAPHGSSARRVPPFKDGDSLTWLAGAMNKRGITLDVGCATGRELFLRLVRGADVVIQTQPQFAYDDLARVNARVVLATLTPYGAAVPHRASDLEVTAASGCLWLAGEPGQPPVRTSMPQSPGWTGMYAAAGVLTALLARENTGRGQEVEVTAQVSMLTATSQAPIFWDLVRQEQSREGAFLVGRSVSGARFRNIWPCRDGFITFALYGGQAGRNTARALVAWMDEVLPDGAPRTLHEIDWEAFDVATAAPHTVAELEAAIAPFFARLTKAEFFREVGARNMLGYPVSTFADVAADEQLAARGFWREVDGLCMPGAFALFDGVRPARACGAPGLGEHNADVYCHELGLSRDDVEALRAAGVV